MKIREGDLIENKSGLIFDVKGLIHPPAKIIAFPRFIPDPHGTRRSKMILYKKVYALPERFQLLERCFPHYLIHDPVFDERLCEVPIGDIEHHSRPVDRLQELRQSKYLDDLESSALEFCALLKRHAKIPWSKIGITGSILAKLQTSNSDIDIVVYGSENCRRTYSALKSLLKEESIFVRPYNRENLKTLFDFRSKDTKISFVDFVRTESRKVLQGKFQQRDYFIRFVKDWSEIYEKYGDIVYVNSGYSRLKATVVDDSEAIFTPCVYTVDNARILEGTKVTPIEEIVSFRGRFCEQARISENVIAQGKVERVRDSKKSHEHFRILLGNTPPDYMALA